MSSNTLTHAIFLAAFIASVPLHAATFDVDTQNDTVDASPGDGVCADADNACSLRAAIEEANALKGADVIELPAGTFMLTIAGIDEDAAATGDLDITDDVQVIGAGGDTTIVDGGALDRVFDVHTGMALGEVTFSQLTIRNGAMENVGADGGAALRVGLVTHVALTDVVIRDNHTTQTSGAVAIDSQGCIEGDHVRILDNTDTASTGSGSSVATVHAYTDPVTDPPGCFTLVDSEMSGNRADQAGAIDLEYVPLTIRRTLISNNEARFAGALITDIGVDALLENVTISGNRGNPGAILNDGHSHLTLVHCTVTGNGPSNGGTNVGGIQDVNNDGFGLTFLSNTILSGNGPGFIADDCSNATSVGGGNIVGDSARCHLDAQPSDQLDVDPGLVPLADNGGFSRTHLPGANAIDHAQTPACTAADQRGLPRPVDGDGDGVALCDVGAVEVQHEVIFANGFDA